MEADKSPAFRGWTDCCVQFLYLCTVFPIYRDVTDYGRKSFLSKMPHLTVRRGRKCRENLKRVCSWMLFVIFLYSTTGFFVVRHICSAESSNTVTLFREYRDETASACSCCSENMVNRDPFDPFSMNMQPESCCRELHFYLKAELMPLPSQKISCSGQSALALELPFFNTGEQAIEVPEYRFGPVVEPKPPPGCRNLIYFLHQVKIPDPVS